jgi:hypothetical protein
MPLIRCPKCGQAYDIPGVIAVRLPSSIATCHCGEWLSGSKAAVLARLIDVDQIREIDMTPYRVDGAGSDPAPPPAPEPPASAPFGIGDSDAAFGIRETSPETPAAPAPAPPPSAEASRAVAPRVLLVCTGGPLEGQEFEIPPSGLVVGREGHVRVPDEFLSRRHFEMVRDPSGSVRVRDLKSRNGTFVNEVAAPDTVVSEGDVISAGVNRFRVEERR